MEDRQEEDEEIELNMKAEEEMAKSTLLKITFCEQTHICSCGHMHAL